MNVMKWKVVLYMGILTGAAICAVRYHAAVSSGILESGKRCVMVILPSLYLFSILAALFVKSGLLLRLGKWLDPCSRRLLHMDGTVLAVLVFSQLGGYPVGAQLLHQLRRGHALTAAQEQTLLCVCMGSGPAFLLGTVCNGLPSSLTAILMISMLLPNLLLGWILSVRGGITISQAHPERPVSSAALLTSAVESAAAAMLKICSMILLFGAMTAVGEEMGVFSLLTVCGKGNGAGAHARLLSVLEISCVTDYIRQGGSLPMAAALLSFGGICVHMQLAAVCEGNLPWLRFWLYRMLAASGTYWCCFWGIRLFCREELPAVVAVLPTYAAEPASGNTVTVVCLLVMSILLLIRWERVLPLRKPLS